MKSKKIYFAGVFLTGFLLFFGLAVAFVMVLSPIEVISGGQVGNGFYAFACFCVVTRLLGNNRSLF